MCSKKIKDKYVSQCGAIVRDNVPISYRELKGKANNPHMVPDLVKNLLWDEILKHFTLPEGVEPINVKCWTLTRMQHNFKSSNSNLIKIISRRIKLQIGLNIQVKRTLDVLCGIQEK
jgi:hypothetical protein